MGVAEGKNLDEWIPESAKPADALFLISQVAGTLAAIPFIHRDVNVRNILATHTSSGLPKFTLVDFGAVQR